MNGVLLVSHCILNPYTAVGGSVPNRAAMKTLLGWALERDVALLQMPCPEFSHAGASRPPRTLEGYDVPEFRAHCAGLVAGVMAALKEHVRAGHRILGLVGIEGSPSCGVELTTRSEAGREAKAAGEGVFTGILRDALATAGIGVPYIGLPHRSQAELRGDGWEARLERLLAESRGAVEA